LKGFNSTARPADAGGSIACRRDNGGDIEQAGSS